MNSLNEPLNQLKQMHIILYHSSFFEQPVKVTQDKLMKLKSGFQNKKMKIFNNIVYFLITIGSNTERRKSRIDYGNMGMIIFYFIQLIGYVYSQYESKSAKFYENDYLAQIGQYSSLPFIMITIHYDPFTILMFAGMFATIVSIYVALLLQIYYKPLERSHFVNRFIKFYFQNFQWYFLTPFHECMVGVKTCGNLAYLKMYSDMENCWQQISLWFMIPSLVGQFLLILSGFLSLYCFRNYEFIQGDLMRKFTILNFLTIILHMILQMCNFWRDLYMYSDIIKHLVLILILFVHSVDSYMNIPFGYSNETIFFSKILGCSTFFEILVVIWIFSNNNDGIIFLTFSIFAPLIFVVIESYFDRYFDKECTNYCLQKQCFNSDYIFEYLCQLSGQEFAQKDCLIVLKYMQLHCQECREVLCPCRQKIQKFVTGQYTLNVTLIYLWIQFQFQKAIKFIIENKLDYEIFESLGIKFVTFLQRYRENQILSQKIIQDILFIYQKLPKHSYPYFFLNLTKIIQNKNKVEMEIQNNSQFQISKVQFNTLHDINLLLVYDQELMNSFENAVSSQRRFWILNKRQTCDLNIQLLHSKEIYDTSQRLKQAFQKFQELRQRPIQDTILILRIKLLISLVCMEDLNATLKLAISISKEENESNAFRDQLGICQFLNGSAVSIISQVSTQTLGSIFQINDQLNQFFGYESDSQYLTTIDKLLPSKIGLIHNGLIENFLQRGKSTRLNQNSEQFILNKDNFIEKVTICLNAVFPLLNDEYQFLMIAHLLKSYKYSKDQSDSNKRGYILVDSEFFVFGLTKNIFERLYQPNQTYENTLIFQLIPDMHSIMEQYFKIQTLTNQKKITPQAQICLRENGFIVAPNSIKRATRKEESVVKLTNKHLVNILKDQRKSMNINKASLKAIPIEYSVLLKVLTPTFNDQVKEFLYFIVEIDFQDDPLLSRQSLQMIQTAQLLKTLKENVPLEKQSNNVILSNDDNENNEEVDLIVDMSNTGSRKSHSDLANRISKVEGQINNKSLPVSLRNLILHFAIQIVLFIIVIIIISSLFKHKKDLQSDCIQQITLDLNFLDVYSLAMAGSRHIIFYRDFYPIIQDSIIIINDKKINVSKHDKIYMAWLQLEQGLIKLIEMYDNYSQIVENSRVKLLNIYLINYDLNNKIEQPVESFAAYYQIMLQVFYMGYKSFASSPDAYLSGTDDLYSIQIARSIIFYNFLDVAANANSTLVDCKIYNTEENNYFDSLIVNYYIGIYLVLSLQFIIIIFFYFRMTKSIKQYFKLLNLCDSEDYSHALQRCDYLISMLQYDRILLRQKQFQSILNQPANIFEDLRKSQIQSTVIGIKKQKKAEVEVHSDSSFKITPSLLVVVLISLIQFLYVFSLQLYYQNLQNNIQPINNRALIAQQMRLNFILSVNRFDLFLIKSYFQSYNGTYLSENVITDTLILKQLEIKTSILEDDINTLQQINFAELLFESSQLNQFEQQQVLGGDVCQLTGCNMKSDLFAEKLFQEQFSPLYYEGIISLHAIILQFLKASATQVLGQVALTENVENILEDPTYIIYFVWGMDAIQYQISQFSQYFIDISLNTLTQLTSYNQISIILIGVGLIIIIFIIQQMFIKQQYRKYLYSKQMIRIVPLPILFQRNIPKHLLNFERKHKYF